MKLDILAIGAHPDDIELTCAGTLVKAAREGMRTGIVDLTQGELGTRGTKQIRAQEAEEAAHILGLMTRRNLKMHDGNIELNRKNLHTVIALLRELQPRILLIPHFNERHPDHMHTYQLAREAWFYSGLAKLKTTMSGKAQQPFRPNNFFSFMQKFEFIPAFIVDVSDTFELRMKSIRAHRSQFFNPESKERETILSKPEFLKEIETRAMYYGQSIGVIYGEPFYSYVPVGIENIFDLALTKG
ncbi:MAG: bacillithiol biosynthesis deacetylase BshB1 [Bacteroidota bacterium]|nr:bacillithiol biosynthesis deacetylase BshB1 [Bacteroidota bacterium]